RFQPFHGGQQTIASPLPIDSGPFVGQEFSTREAAFRNSEFFNKFLGLLSGRHWRFNCRNEDDPSSTIDFPFLLNHLVLDRFRFAEA
ncbi:MAG: hypothetical protein K7J46_21635, partial [Bryobacter sp.]|nr:hypothetical protein [Bryobacteraceae bacterium CoA2 C42]MBZ2187314.1 hypothetical protein [Bryobacter sp. CoA8 C33]